MSLCPKSEVGFFPDGLTLLARTATHFSLDFCLFALFFGLVVTLRLAFYRLFNWTPRASLLVFPPGFPPCKAPDFDLFVAPVAAISFPYLGFLIVPTLSRAFTGPRNFPPFFTWIAAFFEGKVLFSSFCFLPSPECDSQPPLTCFFSFGSG